MGESLFLLCLVTVVAFFGLLGYLIIRAARGSGNDPNRVSGAVNGRVYLRPEHRQVFLNVLRQIQNAPDRDEALTSAATTIENALWLPMDGPLTDVQTVVAPAAPVSPASQPSTTTATVSSTVAPVSAPSASPLRWFAPDNITLLLYVGAALMVIAAGVFVASSWDAIDGVARFLVVAIFALAFLVMGELFIRLTQRLRPAGTTFRAVGTVLLPFVALAYDRFVLEGTGGAGYWVGAGAVLALINYAFYRFTNPGRLTAYLGAFSLGILAFALPDALELSVDWTAFSIWMLAAILLFIMSRIVADGRELLKNLFKPTNHPIAESHLIIGGLLVLLGFGFAFGISDEWLSALSYLLVTAIFIGLAFYFHAGLLAGVATLTGGFTIGFAVTAFAPDMEATLIPLALAVYAALLAFIAPMSSKRLWYGKVFLMGAALFWAFAARTTIESASPTWAHGATIAAYVGITVWAAYRYRNPVVWAFMWLVANGAVSDILSLVPSDSDSILIPALLYLAVAGLWLLLDYLLPAPEDRYARISYVGQALWMTVVAYALGLGRADFVADIPLAGAIALIGLTLGWLWLTVRTQSTLSVIATIAQLALAIPFVLLVLRAPELLLPISWLVAGVILLGVSTVLPDFAKKVTERGGLILALIAPTGAFIATMMNFAESPNSTVTVTSQATLFGAAVVYAAFGILRRERWAIGSAGALLYLLYAWLINDSGMRDTNQIQYYSVPLAVLLFSYRWLFPTQMQIWEGLSAFVLIGVGIVQAVEEQHWLYSAILGAWGVLLLIGGISLSRRILTVAGVVGILFAALRQLWTVVAELPPALIIGLAGLTFLLVAIVLLLTRDRWMPKTEG
jgi:hypothetical protein